MGWGWAQSPSEVLDSLNFKQDLTREHLLEHGWDVPLSGPTQMESLARVYRLLGPGSIEGQPLADLTRARLRELQGRPGEALSLSLKSLEQDRLPEASRSAWRGGFYQRFGDE